MTSRLGDAAALAFIGLAFAFAGGLALAAFAPG